VVETGVGYGVTTAFLLQALAANGAGVLRSIDLPPLERGAEDYAGVLVPLELRARWMLHRGMSRRVLPGVLAEAGVVDLFVHDSMHTLENMRFELGQAWQRLARGGAIVADDIEGNAAFAELAEESATCAVAVRQAEKPALFGVAVK
jgi:predicted O-methyltransferase YrrM